MATQDNLQTQPAATTSKKQDFSGYLRAVDVDRLNAANNTEKPLLQSRRKTYAAHDAFNARLLQATGMLISAIWLAGAAVYVQRSVGWNNVSGLKPHEMGGFLAGILSPIALFWMIAAFIMRSNDVKKYAEALREEIQGMIFPSEEADARVNNDIERLVRQTAEMSKATRMALAAIESARDGLRTQVNVLNDSSEMTVDRLDSLSQALSARMNDAAEMGQKLDTTLQALEDRSVMAAERLNAGRQQLDQTVDRIDSSSANSETSIARLSDMLRERLDSLGNLHQQTESALQNASDEMATQRRELRLEAEAIEQKAYGITDALQKTTSKMYEFSDDALDKAKLIETRLQGQSASLQHILQQSTEQAQAVDAAMTQSMTALGTATEKMTAEAYHVEEVLKNAIERLEDRTQTHSGQVQQSMSAATDAMLGHMDQISERLKGNLAATQDQLSITTTALNTEMADVGNRINDSINLVQEKLNAGTQHLMSEINRIDDHVNSNVTNVQEKIGHAARHLVDEVGKINQHIQSNVTSVQEKMEATVHHLVAEVDRMDQHMQSSVTNIQEKIGGYARHLIDEVEKIDQNIQSSVATIEGNIGTTVQHLIDKVETIDQHVQSNVTSVQEKIGAAAQHLIGEVDQINERAKTMTDTMLNEVNRKVMDTTSAFTYIQKQIQALANLFDERKLHLDDASTSARQTAETMSQTLQLALNKVAETTDALQKGVGSIHLSLQQPISLLENVATMAYRRADDIGQLLQDKATNLTATAEQMGLHVSHIQNQLFGKGQDVALIAGKIASHLRSVTQELESQNTLLDGRVVQSMTSLTSFQHIQQNIADNLSRLQERTIEAAGHSTASVDTIQQRINILQQLQQALSANAEQAHDKIAHVSDNMIHVSAETVQKITQSIEKMGMLELDYNRLSEAGINDIQRLETGYRDLLQNVGSQTEQTNQTVSQHLTILQDTAQNFAQTGQTINVQTAHIQELAQSAASTLQQAIGLSQNFDERIEANNRNVSIHIDTIRETMTQMQSQALNAVDALVHQEETLMQQTQKTISTMVDSKNTTRTLVEQMQETLSKMRDEGSRTETTLGQSVSRLVTYNDQIDTSTNNLLERINQANHDLLQQSRNLHNTNEDVMIHLQQAGAYINTHATALENAAKAAQQQAKTLRAQETKLNRDAFFNSTKFVVESLHSLALDFTRMLDGELHDKTWRAYQKGDVASFTRRLLSARDADTQSKIEAKFKDDVEFRTYVQRYLRQFEEVYDSAIANDHAELLATIFSTSDVGRLYQFLCATLDREPRGAKN